LARNTIHLQDKIETLEYLHDLLDSPAHAEIKKKVRIMINAYRVQEKKETEGYPYQQSVYIPPAL